jgi:CelD/BcsL family acetyltransferase involved in cellulose biosynthesis
LDGEWEAFYRAKRSSATRRHDRAKRKRMAEFGDIRFMTAVGQDEIKKTFDTLWEQKKWIFARKGIPDIFAKPGYHQFFLDFASNPQTRHLAHVSRVDIGTTCAAANFAIVFGDCYYHVLSSYCDGRLTRHGPGTLHLRELLAHAIALGLRQFDFTIGDDPYKLEWSDLRVDLYDFSTAARWRGWPVSVLSAVRRRLKRFIKQTPIVWHLVCRATTRRNEARSRAAMPCSASPVMPRATPSNSLRSRVAFAVRKTRTLRRSSSLRTRRISPDAAMPRSAITVVGSIMPTSADNSRCESPSAFHNTRRKYHWPRVTP